MIIYDITRELFSTEVYPGDPIPDKKSVLAIKEGNVCNVSGLYLGSHSGTHMDAPLHFIENGRDVAEVELSKCVGNCLVLKHDGVIRESFWEKVALYNIDKILIKGDVIVDEESADNFVERGVVLIGVETPTVGQSGFQEQVHKKLLGNEIVILETLVLNDISEGTYFLVAQPLKMEGVDGSPVRALLIEGM